MQAFRFSIPSFILGLISGSLIETHLRRAPIISGGSFEVFHTCPISAVFLCASGLSIADAVWQGGRHRAAARH